jgi:galactan 5-O-arabinofuranosyltransferase
VGEALIGAATAALTVLLVHAIVAASNFDARDDVAPGLGAVWAGAMVGVALLGYLAQRRAPERSSLVVAGLAGVAAGLATLPLTAGLHGTAQPPFTISRGDQQFRTEYVTRFAATWHLDDYTFKGLHAFYPPAWFWLAGRTAHVLGTEPWRIIKPFTIGTIGVALGLSFVLWRRVLTPAGALAAAIGSSLVLTHQTGALGLIAHSTQGWYSPYSCFVAVTGAAWLAASLTWTLEGGRRRGAVLLVAVGALLALTYYLLFLILVGVLIVLALAPRGTRRASAARLGIGIGAIALLTAIFWVPLAVSILKGAASQGHYLAPDFLNVSAGFDGPKALVLLAVAAAAALVMTWAWSASRAVAGLLIGTVIYQLISVTSLVFSENQLQPHRAVTMLWATLGAAVPVALDGVNREGVLARGLPAATLRGATALIAVIAVPATFLLGTQQGRDLVSGPLTIGARDPVDFRTADAASRFIVATTGRSPDQLTIVTEARGLLITRPYYGFLGLSARYSHPEAHQAARVKILERAADCSTAACTTRLLLHNRFGPIDALVLRRTPLGFEITTQIDAFPAPRIVTIDFPPGRLSPAAWVSARVGPDTVFVRRPGGQPAAAASPSSSPSGTRTHTPAPVSKRAGRPGRKASRRRERSGRRARTPRSS